mgnify:CR=1 FL=1
MSLVSNGRPSTTNVPDEAGVWSYEPKWDGFLYWILQVEAPINHRRTVVVALQ